MGTDINPRQALLDRHPDTEFVFMEGFDFAIIGTDAFDRVVYSIPKIITVLMSRDKMTFEQAIEYLEYNIVTAYVGEKTPLYVDPLEEDELEQAFTS